MRTAFRKALPIMMVAGGLVAGGCASSGDVDRLNSEVNGLRGDIQKLREETRATRAELIKAQEMALQASNNAAASSREAQNAANAANAAAEKSERMFQKTLRK